MRIYCDGTFENQYHVLDAHNALLLDSSHVLLLEPPHPSTFRVCYTLLLVFPSLALVLLRPLTPIRQSVTRGIQNEFDGEFEQRLTVSHVHSRI